MDVAVDIAFLCILFLLNGFFAMAEMAVVSSRRIRLQQMAEEGRRGAAQALALVDSPGSFLTAVQVGITLIGILSGAFGGATLGVRLGPVLEQIPLVAPYGSQIAVVLVVVAITAVSVIVGSLVPKRMALAAPEAIAVRVARPLQIIARVSRPFVWLLEKSSAALLRLFGLPERRGPSVTEEEVRFAIAEGAEAGVIDEVEEEMIHGVLALADRSVAAIMTPRPDVHWIDLDDDAGAISPVAPIRAWWWRAAATSAVRSASSRRRIWSTTCWPAAGCSSSATCASRSMCPRMRKFCACWRCFAQCPCTSPS